VALISFEQGVASGESIKAFQRIELGQLATVCEGDGHSKAQRIAQAPHAHQRNEIRRFVGISELRSVGMDLLASKCSKADEAETFW